MNHNNVIPFRTSHSSSTRDLTEKELDRVVQRFQREKATALQLDQRETLALLSLTESLDYQLQMFGEQFHDVVNQLQKDRAMLDDHYRVLQFA